MASFLSDVMNSDQAAHGSLRQLIDQIEQLLDVAGFENSESARARLALALCDRLGGRLDGERLAAVNAAREFWGTGQDAEYKKWLGVFWSSREDSRPGNPIDRLVWSALARSGGLDGHAAEFLVLEAIDAGIGRDELSQALAEVVPGYAAGCGAGGK